MAPDEITLSGYRCFEEAQSIELRPLTLLFGRNNAGKSALLRALPLLADTIGRGSTDVLSLDAPAARGASFADLSFDRRDEGFSVELSWRSEQLRLRLALRRFADWSRIVLNRFEVIDESVEATQRSVLALEWDPVREERERPGLSYRVSLSGNALGVMSVVFRGMCPEGIGIVLPPRVRRALALLQEFGSGVQWLEAVRARPSRVAAEPNGPRWRLRPSGDDAALAMRSIAAVREGVANWYQRACGLRVSTNDDGASTFALTVEREGSDRPSHAVADLGEGALQVLPVLVAMELARQHASGGPAILAIEEPESHLHPGLQVELARHLCGLAASAQPPRVLVETHSEHLFAGVQLAVLEGRLSPEALAVYWVAQDDDGLSAARRVVFDEKMRVVEGWPMDAFREDTDLAEMVIEARGRLGR